MIIFQKIGGIAERLRRNSGLVIMPSLRDGLSGRACTSAKISHCPLSATLRAVRYYVALGEATCRRPHALLSVTGDGANAGLRKRPSRGRAGDPAPTGSP